MNEDHKLPCPIPGPSGSGRASSIFGLFTLTIDSGHAADGNTSGILSSVVSALSSHLNQSISCQIATLPNISKVGGK